MDKKDCIERRRYWSRAGGDGRPAITAYRSEPRPSVAAAGGQIEKCECLLTGRDCYDCSPAGCFVPELQRELDLIGWSSAKSRRRTVERGRDLGWSADHLKQMLERHDAATAESKRRSVEAARKRWLLRED